MTTGELLVSLSPLETGTALEHLMAIRGDLGGSTTTGELLVYLSSLETGTAIEHLMAITSGTLAEVVRLISTIAQSVGLTSRVG